MEIKAQQVKELRDMTGAGMMDAKKALIESDGNMDKAVDILREKGIAKSLKKGGRVAAEGLIGSYVHQGRIGAMVEVNSETDFVAKNQDFQDFVKYVCMQVASMNPKYVSRADVPEEEVAHEREVLTQKAMNESENIPEDKRKFVAEKKVEGRLEKFYEEICLMDMKHIMQTDKTVEQVRQELVSKIGENIVVRRFIRFEVGEGIEKKQENFAEEVKKQMQM